MPKFLEMYGWRFFAVMFDLLNEPFADKGKKECKYWIVPDGHIQLAYNRGFSTADRNKIERTIKDNLSTILNQYKGYCDENNLKPTYRTLRENWKSNRNCKRIQAEAISLLVACQ